MALENTLVFNTTDPLPVRDDGGLAIVILKRQQKDGHHFTGGSPSIEYYGDPVVVSRWSSKILTTICCLRLNYSDVVGWIDICKTPCKSYTSYEW